VDAKDATTKVWLFSELVKNKPAKGSNDYPVAIKAIHLDENWKRTTLRAPKDTDPAAGLYEVAYEDDGTYITRLLPDGTNNGDLLYWNGERWVVLAAPDSATMHALTITSGTLAWTQTEDCEA
jgi:hypothetical protein